MTFPETNPENHRGNGKYFRNRRAPSPCGGGLGWGQQTYRVSDKPHIPFTYT